MDGAKLLPPNSTPSSPDESFEQLRERLSLLSGRVSQLEERLAAVESGRPAVASAVSSSLPISRQESRVGLTLVNRAGAVTLAIGILLFFKYAADNKWIGAEGRVVLGVAAGLLLLIAAEWQRRRNVGSPASEVDTSVFAQGIAGAGLAIIYAAVYAAVAYYELIIPVAGWIFLVLVSGCAVFLSVRYRSSAIAALGFAGGLVTPLLLHNAATAWWFDFIYLFALTVTALALAMRQRWPALIPGLAALALLSAVVSFNAHHAAWFAIFSLLLAAAHFAAARSSEDVQIRNFAYLTGHGCFLAGSARAVALWAADHSSPEDRYSFTSALESVLVAIYGIVALTYGIAKSAVRDRSLGLFLLGLVIAKLYLWDVWQLNRFYRISAFVALGILLLAASYIYSRVRARTSS